MKLNICYPLNLPFPISQKWNENPQYYNAIGLKGHNGWDFSVVEGTPVYATHDGTVWFSGIDGTMSKTIMISTDSVFDYKDGQEQFRTVYAHLSDYFVTPGQKVKRGELIGKTGNTGRYTTGPHLHFGIHPIRNFSDIEVGNGYNGCVDPAPYFDGTYPNSVLIAPVDDTKLKAAKFALRDWQVSVGIRDFANETDYKKIKFGPKSQKLFNN